MADYKIEEGSPAFLGKGSVDFSSEYSQTGLSLREKIVDLKVNSTLVPHYIKNIIKGENIEISINELQKCTAYYAFELNREFQNPKFLDFIGLWIKPSDDPKSFVIARDCLIILSNLFVKSEDPNDYMTPEILKGLFCTLIFFQKDITMYGLTALRNYLNEENSVRLLESGIIDLLLDLFNNSEFRQYPLLIQKTYCFICNFIDALPEEKRNKGITFLNYAWSDFFSPNTIIRKFASILLYRIIAIDEGFVAFLSIPDHTEIVNVIETPPGIAFNPQMEVLSYLCQKGYGEAFAEEEIFKCLYQKYECHLGDEYLDSFLKFLYNAAEKCWGFMIESKIVEMLLDYIENENSCHHVIEEAGFVLLKLIESADSVVSFDIAKEYFINALEAISSIKYQECEPVIQMLLNIDDKSDEMHELLVSFNFIDFLNEIDVPSDNLQASEKYELLLSRFEET